MNPITVFSAIVQITKKRHPCQDLPQDYGGIKSLCPIWIRPTGDFQSHPRQVSASMNDNPVNANEQVNS